MTSAPKALTELTLMSGVVLGMTMVALIPKYLADMATPWAWLPAEAATKPLACCAWLNCEMQL